jgi:hypothetical protein
VTQRLCMPVQIILPSFSLSNHKVTEPKDLLAQHQEVGPLYMRIYAVALYLTPNPQIGIKICSILGRPLSKKGKRK